MSPIRAPGADNIHENSHASTSEKRITSPVIIVPGHDPITTNLTPTQLSTLLPTLHHYIVPYQPSVALLPAYGISHIGLITALRWRECEIAAQAGHHNKGVETSLAGLIQIHAALRFLGNTPKSPIIIALLQQIVAELDDPLTLDIDDFRSVWELRHLPFTDRFVQIALEGIVIAQSKVGELMGYLRRQDRAGANDDVREWVADQLEVREWVESDAELRERVDRIRKRNKKTVQKTKVTSLGRSAIDGWKSGLDTVPE